MSGPENFGAIKPAVYQLHKKTQAPPLKWGPTMAKGNGPSGKSGTGASSEPARGRGRTLAEIKLVGVDASGTSAIHTESHWRGAFEHTSVRAAIMAVLALVKRLTEHTQGSQESNQKITAALDDIVAAFKDRKPTHDGLNSAEATNGEPAGTNGETHAEVSPGGGDRSEGLDRREGGPSI